MLLVNEFHNLGPWNRIEIFLIFFLQMWGRKSQSILLNIDESDFQFERFE